MLGEGKHRGAPAKGGDVAWARFKQVTRAGPCRPGCQPTAVTFDIHLPALRDIHCRDRLAGLRNQVMAPATAPQRRWLTYVAIGCAVVFVCICAAVVAAAAYTYVRSHRALAAQPTVEYILDASPRMETASTSGDTRLAVARGVLADIVRTADPRLTAGLRVFGTGALPQGCQDTDLLVPFAAANQEQIEDGLGGVAGAPQSDSPVAEAMVSAIKDMASTAGPHSIIVVTGGADSCNPESGVLVQREAERAGIDLKLFVIGFEVPADEVEAVRALVDLVPGAIYLDAPDSTTLRQQLTDVQTDVNRRAAEALEEPEEGSAGHAAETACDHPYFPMRTGANWSYAATEGTLTWSISDASGSTDSASAVMEIVFPEGSMTTHWTCTPAGIVSYDFGSISAGGMDAVVSMEVSDSSGVWLPAAELLTPGYSWTNQYTTTVSASALGADVDITSTTDETLTVAGTETVSVPAGTFEALRVDSTMVMTFSGMMGALPSMTTSSSFWYAEGIGPVRYVYSSADYSGGGDLTSYSVP